MRIGVGVKIDVTKINKEFLFKSDKGAYLNTTVFIDVDTPDKFGNHGMVTQDVPREAKSNFERGPILGNAKIFWRDSGDTASRSTLKPAIEGDDFNDDLPF